VYEENWKLSDNSNVRQTMCPVKGWSKCWATSVSTIIHAALSSANSKRTQQNLLESSATVSLCLLSFLRDASRPAGMSRVECRCDVFLFLCNAFSTFLRRHFLFVNLFSLTYVQLTNTRNRNIVDNIAQDNRELWHLFPNLTVLVANNEGMRTIKLCFNKMLKVLIGGAG